MLFNLIEQNTIERMNKIGANNMNVNVTSNNSPEQLLIGND